MQNLSIYFWRAWPKPYRLLFVTLGVLLVAVTAIMWFVYLRSPAPAIEIQTVQEAELMEVPTHQFQRGIFQISVAGNNYILFERFLGNPLQVSAWGAYLFLACLLTAVVVLLAVFTTLSRFYYLVCMGLFVLFVVSLRLEVLFIFGTGNKIFTIATLALFALTSFYIHYFNRNLTFTQRLAIFGFLMLLFTAMVGLLAEVDLPFHHLASNGVAAGVVVTVLVVLMVAHEILAGVITLLTSGTQASKSLNHFLIVSLIYLINLALTYAIKFKFIHWNLLSIDIFLLFTISTFLGVWGLKQRQRQFGGILEIEPYGLLAFVSMATVAMGALAWFFQSANDPAHDALGDLIIFSHLGYGLIFVLYVIANFFAMLAKNMAVHKVLYNPTNMPYFSFRLAGLIATLAFAFYNTWQVPVQNLVAGYYNTAGDLYLALGNLDLSKAYYERSGYYGYGNHHGNYALANIEGLQSNTSRERVYYERASVRRPTDMSVLNWAQTFQTDRNNLQALFTLKDALETTPEHGALENTVAYLFYKAGSIDSARTYFQRAADHQQETVANSNLMGMDAHLRNPFSLSDTATVQSLLHHIPFKTNSMARLNATRAAWPARLDLPKDSVLDNVTVAWINNYLMNQPLAVDTVQLVQLEKLARKPVNESQREVLMFALAQARYQQGHVAKALQLLEEVTISSSSKGRYNNILTQWTLEQGEYNRALGYADYAIGQQFEPAKITKAVVLTEAARIQEALTAWDSVRVGKDTVLAQLVGRVRSLLTLPAAQAFLLSDEDKYAFARYRLSWRDSLVANEFVQAISDPHLKARLLLDRSRLMASMDHTKEALDLLQQIRSIPLRDKMLFDEIRLHEISLLSTRSDAAALEAQLQPDIDFSGTRQKFRWLAEATLAESRGDALVASRLYRWLGTSNPFFEEGVVAAARYFQSRGQQEMAYQLLVDALLSFPSSIRIRKAYCLEAARAGFSSFATGALSNLQSLIPERDYLQLANEVQGLIQEKEGDY